LLWRFYLLALLMLEVREFAREIPVESSLSIATEWEVKDIEATVCSLNGSNAEPSITYWKLHPKTGNPLFLKRHLPYSNPGKTQGAPLHHRNTRENRGETPKRNTRFLKFPVTGWWSHPISGRDSKKKRKYIFLKPFFLTKCYFLNLFCLWYYYYFYNESLTTCF